MPMDLVLKALMYSDALDLDAPDINGAEDFSDAVAKHFEASDLRKLGVPTFSADWDEPVGVLAKREDSKSLAKAARYEVREIDGERWSLGLTADGETASMRLLLPEHLVKKYFSD